CRQAGQFRERRAPPPRRFSLSSSLGMICASDFLQALTLLTHSPSCAGFLCFRTTSIVGRHFGSGTPRLDLRPREGRALYAFLGPFEQCLRREQESRPPTPSDWRPLASRRKCQFTERGE